MKPKAVAPPEGLLKALLTKLPKDSVSTDPSDLETYGRDWTKVFTPNPCAIVFPQSTADVVTVVKLCSEYEVAVVPSGGRTGLSAGAVASRGELVLSFARMRHMGEVDTLAHTVRVQAGAVTQAVHEHCASHGLTWPIDFASKGSSTVGGNISTNAGGVRVIRYGLTRHWVLGLQVVAPNGDILELGGELEKNQTGLDLRQLYIGTEGTLGIVTEATLRLCSLPQPSQVFFFALSDIASVLALFREARRTRFDIQAFEVLGDNCLAAVEEHRKLHSPFADRTPYYVLLEVETPGAEADRSALESWLADLFEKGLVTNGVLAQSSEEARKLWELREGISESLSAAYLVHKHDIALPISKLGGFLEALLSSLAKTYAGLELYVFGHIGDGNLHINLRKPSELSKEEFLRTCRAIDDSLFALVQQFKGSISAEHGIGLLKKHALHFTRSAAEIEIMRTLKKALDPKNLLNPGKILD